MFNRDLSILVGDLRAQGAPDPLLQRFTLAAVQDELARLGGEVPPSAVQAMRGEPTRAVPVAAACDMPGRSGRDSEGGVPAPLRDEYTGQR